MSLLDWKPAYSLGIPSVDFEHRDLIRQINEAYSLLERQADAESIEACLEGIYASIASHFALEERHMRDADYSAYPEHKDDHEDLLDQIRDLMDGFIDDPEAGRATLRKQLADWFRVHFATHDARLHAALGETHAHD